MVYYLRAVTDPPDPAMTDKLVEFKPTTIDIWTKAAAKSAPGGNVEALNWITPDGIAVKPLYTAADTADLQHADTLPGYLQTHCAEPQL